MQTTYNLVPAVGVEGQIASDMEGTIIVPRLAQGLVPVGKLCANGTDSMTGPPLTTLSSNSTNPGQVKALPAGIVAIGGGAAASAGGKKPRKSTAKAKAGASGDDVAAPMQGTIVKVAVAEGAQVAEGDLVVVLEAMKMEQPLKAHKAGTVTGLQAEVGATVTNGAVICELKD